MGPLRHLQNVSSALILDKVAVYRPLAQGTHRGLLSELFPATCSGS